MNLPPNYFLVSRVGHGQENCACFCAECRQLMLGTLDGISYNDAYRNFMELLPLKEDERLDQYHDVVRQKIVWGEYYKQTALTGTTYTYFKAWARKEFTNLTEKELDKLCEKVNKASWVFRNWEVIVENLTNSSLTSIDARKFSVNMFYQAKQLSWCINHNNTLRQKGRKRSQDGDEVYSEESFERLVQSVFSNGILREVEYEPTAVSAILGRLQDQIVSYCDNRDRR